MHGADWGALDIATRRSKTALGCDDASLKDCAGGLRWFDLRSDENDCVCDLVRFECDLCGFVAFRRLRRRWVGIASIINTPRVLVVSFAFASFVRGRHGSKSDRSPSFRFLTGRHSSLQHEVPGPQRGDFSSRKGTHTAKAMQLPLGRKERPTGCCA